MPIDAFIFGGRRSTTVPLVTEAKSWRDGVYMAATLGSRDHRGDRGQGGRGAARSVRDDRVLRLPHRRLLRPLADARQRSSRSTPKIYLVNWFRKDADGKFLWPGYGENMRVLKWIVERVEGKGAAGETPLGNVPRFADLDWNGLDGFSAEKYADATSIVKEQWSNEMKLHTEMVEGKLAADRVPPELFARYQTLKALYPF